MNELEKQISHQPAATLSSLSTQHEIRNILRDVHLLFGQCFNRDEIVLLFAQKVVQLLYKHESILAREVFVLLLEKLCEISKRLTREIKDWLLYHDDEVSLFGKQCS